jgi:uncharacterized protein (DUF1697 family)
MKTYIALFRGINIGGHHLLPMKDLVPLLQDLGLENIRTYIQSGNVVFQNTAQDASRLAGKIRTAIRKARGFEPQVLLLEPKDLIRAIAANPFPEAASNPGSLHVLFLLSTPASPDLEKLEQVKGKSEQFKLKGGLFYLYAPDGVGRSRLAANVERLLGVPVTGRNWKTVQGLLTLATGKA